MPTSHRTPAVLLLLPALLAGGACAGSASAQVTFEFTNSGQALGNNSSFSVALGDLDGDGDLDAMVANQNQPNTVWTNDVEPIATGACCVASGCTINTETACTELGGSWTESGSCDDCPTTCPADLNHDGVVDGFDLTVVLGAWGLPCDG